MISFKLLGYKLTLEKIEDIKVYTHNIFHKEIQPTVISRTDEQEWEIEQRWKEAHKLDMGCLNEEY